MSNEGENNIYMVSRTEPMTHNLKLEHFLMRQENSPDFYYPRENFTRYRQALEAILSCEQIEHNTADQEAGSIKDSKPKGLTKSRKVHLQSMASSNRTQNTQESDDRDLLWILLACILSLLCPLCGLCYAFWLCWAVCKGCWCRDK